MEHSYAINNTGHTNEREKLRIIQLHARGSHVDEICEKTGRSRATVFRVIKAFRDDSRLSRIHPPGRPLKFDCGSQIQAFITDNPFARDRDAIRELNLGCSTSTYARRCKEMDRSSFISSSKFALTDAQREARIIWCIDHEDWGI